MAMLCEQLLYKPQNSTAPTLLGFLLRVYPHHADIYLYLLSLLLLITIIILPAISHMNHWLTNCVLFIIALVLTFCHTSLHTQTQYRYREHAKIIQDKIVKLQFIITNQLLPYPLRSLIKNYNTSINIKFGNYYHRTNNLDGKLIGSNLITTMFQSNNVPFQLKQIISSIFMVSLQQRYSISYSDIQATLFNDPNDKFCIHHIEQVIRNFLPCGVNSGISQMIDIDTFFVGNRLYGMEIDWKQNKMTISILIQLSNKLQGLKKVKISEKCLKQSQLVISDANNQPISQREVVVAKYLQRFQSNEHESKVNEQNNIKMSRSVEGNWYGPHKRLKWVIEWKNVKNGSIIVMRQILPAFAKVSSILVKNMNNPQEKVFLYYHCDIHKMSQQSKYGQANLICTFKLQVTSYLPQSQGNKYQIVCHLQNELTNFDLYQSIFGGGIQLPVLPLVLYSIDQAQPHAIFQKVIYYNSQPASLRTPQPDQALPFQAITFGVGVFGYLWLGIWRKFANDLKVKLQD